MVSEHNFYRHRVCKQLVRERIWVEHLKIGMYVAELDRSWLGTPFLLQGFLITDAKDIDLLRQHCQFVYIDIAKTKLSNRDIQIAINAKRKSEKDSQLNHNYALPVEKELISASIVYASAKRSLNSALDDFKKSKEIDIPEIKNCVKSCVKSIRNNPNAMIWLSQIKNRDDYTAEHSIRVAMMAMALGAALGLTDTALQELGVAAMLHDVGKIEIPDTILNKQGKLTDSEYIAMKKHVVYGREMLLAQPGVPMIAAEVAYTHHEHVGGGGYPRGIMDNKIHQYAKIVSVVDAYDAMTSERVYSGAKSALEGLGILYECKGKQFDQQIVQTFIQLIGVYPPGNIVELNDGSVAIVLSSTPDTKLKPKLMLVRNASKRLCPMRIIDLSAQPKEDALVIKSVLQDGVYGINLRAYRDDLIAKGSLAISA